MDYILKSYNFLVDFTRKNYKLIVLFIVLLALVYFFYIDKLNYEVELEERYLLKRTELENTYTENTKKLNTQIDTIQSEYYSYRKEVESSIDAYKSEIGKLKSKVVEKTYRIVKADGTIIEKTFKQSETEQYQAFVNSIQQEYNSKIQEAESKWMETHKKQMEEQKQILESKHQLEIQELYTKYSKPKEYKYTVSVGKATNNTMYINTTYVLAGPLLLNGQINNISTSTVDGGIGLGIRF